MRTLGACRSLSPARGADDPGTPGTRYICVSVPAKRKGSGSTHGAFGDVEVVEHEERRQVSELLSPYRAAHARACALHQHRFNFGLGQGGICFKAHLGLLD